MWPAAEFPLDATRIGATYQALRRALAREIVLGNADQLDRALGPIPADLTVPGAIGAWLGGYLPLRWVGLRVLAETYPSDDRLELTGRVVVPEGQTRVVAGDVRISGELVLADRARVLVLGTLAVTGALVAPSYGYSLIGVRNLECANGMTGGELLALESIRCHGTFLLEGDGQPRMAPHYSGDVLVDYEWPADFDEIDVAQRVSGGVEELDYDAARAALGLPSAEHGPTLGSEFTAKLLDGRAHD